MLLTPPMQNSFGAKATTTTSFTDTLTIFTAASVCDSLTVSPCLCDSHSLRMMGYLSCTATTAYCLTYYGGSTCD